MMVSAYLRGERGREGDMVNGMIPFMVMEKVK